MPNDLSPLTAEARARGHAARRAAREQRTRECAAAVDALMAVAGGAVPKWAQAWAEKARRGSLRALVALKCADCSCWDRAEIRECTLTACPLHPFRPYLPAEG
jgi:hypothetical protein